MSDKEPKSFEQFAKDAYASLRKGLDSFRKRSEVPVKRRIAELQNIVSRGQGAREFTSGTFFHKHVLPMMQEEAAKAMKPWVPGDAFDPYEVKANYFYASGQATAANKFLNKFKIWIEEGEQAAREIEFEVREKERLKNMGAFV